MGRSKTHGKWRQASLNLPRSFSDVTAAAECTGIHFGAGLEYAGWKITQDQIEELAKQWIKGVIGGLGPGVVITGNSSTDGTEQTSAGSGSTK